MSIFWWNYGAGSTVSGGSPPATPTLAVADNADDTGGVATVTNSTVGSTNTLYAAAVDGSVGAWAAVDSRTGDGTITITNSAVIVPGHYFWIVRSSLTGQEVCSNVVYQPLTDGDDSLHDRVLDAVKTRLELRGLTDIAGVYVRKVPHLVNCDYPCVVVTTFGQSETEEEQVSTTGRDGIGLPVYLVFLDREPYDHDDRRWKLWRQQVRRTFRSQRLPGVPEIDHCRHEGRVVVNLEKPGGAGAESFAASALLLRFLAREQRGLSA